MEKYIWDKETNELMIELRNEGLDVHEIGKRIGRRSGPVAAQLNKLGVGKRITKNVILAANTVVHYKTCQFPIGDPLDDDFHYCGDKVVSNKPYCKHHYDVAYVRISQEQRILDEVYCVS